MGRSKLLRAGALVAPALIFLAVYSVHPPSVPLISPDSDSYLNFAGIRSGGYPFFLAILKPLIRDTADYAVAQLVLYALAVAAFGRQLLRTYGNPLICLLIELLLLGNVEINQYHFTIATESVFLSTSALFLGATLAHLRTGSAVSLAAAAGSAAYLLAIRLTGLVFVAALPIVLLAAPGLTRRTSVARIAAVLVPFIVVVGAESLYYRAYHSGPRESLLPTQMIGKAGMIEVADPKALIDAAPAAAKPLQTALEFGLAPMRALVRGVPSLAARCRVEANYETFVQYQFAPTERAALVAAAGQGGVTQAAVARMRHGLPDYARLTADYFYCLWTLSLAGNDEKAALAAYLDAHKPLPFEGEVGSFATSRSPPLVGLVRAAMLGVAALLALAAVCLAGALWRRRGPRLELAMAGTCGLVVHLGLLISALGGVGIPRYTHGLWVPLALGIAFAAAWLARAVSAGMTPGRVNAPADSGAA